MSEASSTAAAAPKGRQQRSVKNYLLDQHFQLKYAGFLAGIALALSIALGLILWNTNSKIIEQSKRAVEQGQRTVEQHKQTIERGEKVIVQSQQVSQAVAISIAQFYRDDPDLAKTFNEESASQDNKLKDEQEQLVHESAMLTQRAEELKKQAEDVATQARSMLIGLVVALSLLVVFVGLAGIVFTHKVAGPIFKMKRLLRQVGEGKLVLHERLRKGDELQDFFETFEKMVENLRIRQEAEMAKVDAILDKLEAAPASGFGGKNFDDDGIELLKKLRAEMQDQLDA
jgi:nitrogen fixation/metabolism regulation signal transduction histidine kinase